MKTIVNRVMVALLLVTLASAAAFAKGKRVQVSFFNGYQDQRNAC